MFTDFDTPRRFSPSDTPQGRDLVTMTRQEFNRTTQSLQELRKENSNMHRELNELRHFRKETLKHQKSAEDTRKSSAVSQENDLAFRKLLEEKLPTRKERSRSRRPTFPGSSAPALNLFSGYEKKQFSKGTLLGTNNKLKMTQTAGNVQDTATLSNAQVVGAAHNRGRQPIRESVFPTGSRGTSDTGKVSYAAAVAGRDSRKTKSDSGVISSGESSPTVCILCDDTERHIITCMIGMAICFQSL